MLTEQKRIFLLILIMTLVALVVGGVSIAMLYQAAFTEEEARLTEAAQSQARLIEAVARFNEAHQKQWHPDVGVPKEYTLDQIRDAHKNYVGFGKTGEFTLAQLGRTYAPFAHGPVGNRCRFGLPGRNCTGRLRAGIGIELGNRGQN